jgi:hypothetical protein
MFFGAHIVFWDLFVIVYVVQDVLVWSNDRVMRWTLGIGLKVIKLFPTVQCSGSAFYFGRLDPDPNLHWEYGSGSRRAKMNHESEEKSCFEALDPGYQYWTQCDQILPYRPVLWIRIHFGRRPDPDPHWEYGSGSRRAKMNHKSEENSSFNC